MANVLDYDKFVNRLGDCEINEITDEQRAILSQCDGIRLEFDFRPDVGENIKLVWNDSLKFKQCFNLKKRSYFVVPDQLLSNQGEDSDEDEDEDEEEKQLWLNQVVLNPFWVMEVVTSSEIPGTGLRRVLFSPFKFYGQGSGVSFTLGQVYRLPPRQNVMMIGFYSELLAFLLHDSKNKGSKRSHDGSVKDDEGKFYLTDLDGVARAVQLKSQVDKMFPFRGLFRLMNEERFDLLFSDGILNLNQFRINVESMIQTSNNLPTHLSSLSLINQINKFQVFNNDELFTSFLKGEWSPFNWNNLSLNQFVSCEYSVDDIICPDEQSPRYNNNITRLIHGVQTFLSFIFGEVFQNVFVKLLDLFTGSSTIRICHAIYVKAKVELLMNDIFCDLLRRKKSIKFPYYPMSSPRQCVEIISLHIENFKESISTWETTPHTTWYHSLNGSENITLDPTNYNSLRQHKQCFKGKQWNLQIEQSRGNNNSTSTNYSTNNNYYSENNTILKNNSTNHRVKFSPSTISPPSSRASSPSSPSPSTTSPRRYICIWDISNQLKVMFGDVLATCNKNTCKQRNSHCKVGEVTVDEMIQAVDSSVTGEKKKDIIKAAVYKNKNKFKQL